MTWKTIKIATETKKKLLERAQALPQDTSTIYHAFPDGWTFRELNTIGDHWRESQLMGNCVSKAMSYSMSRNLDRWMPFCEYCGSKSCESSLNNLIRENDVDCRDLHPDYIMNALADYNAKTPAPMAKIMEDYATRFFSEWIDSGDNSYLSLRDPDNIPHLTFGQGYFRGRHNATPKPKYQKYIDLIRDELPNPEDVLDEDYNIN